MAYKLLSKYWPFTEGPKRWRAVLRGTETYLTLEEWRGAHPKRDGRRWRVTMEIRGGYSRLQFETEAEALDVYLSTKVEIGELCEKLLTGTE